MATEMEMEIKAVLLETAIEMETIDLTLLVHTGTDPCMLELYKNLIDLNPLSSSPLFIFNVNSIQ